MLQIVALLIDAARGIIYDRHMFIVQAIGDIAMRLFSPSSIMLQKRKLII